MAMYEEYYDFCRKTTGYCGCSERGELCDAIEDMVDNGVTAAEELERVELEAKQNEEWSY